MIGTVISARFTFSFSSNYDRSCRLQCLNLGYLFCFVFSIVGLKYADSFSDDMMLLNLSLHVIALVCVYLCLSSYADWCSSDYLYQCGSAVFINISTCSITSMTRAPSGGAHHSSKWPISSNELVLIWSKYTGEYWWLRAARELQLQVSSGGLVETQSMFNGVRCSIIYCTEMSIADDVRLYFLWLNCLVYVTLFQNPTISPKVFWEVLMVAFIS